MVDFELAKRDYKPVICVDFDGVCTNYSGYKGKNVFDPPLYGATRAIKHLRKLGFIVIIFTSREDNQYLRKYLKSFNFEFDGINTNKFNFTGYNSPKPGAEYYIDDNALRFDIKKGGWRNILDRIEYYEKERIDSCQKQK